jgi:type I restriction enzyme M protein
MIDASKGFTKDGPKNRLRERDIHRMVETFNSAVEVPGYSRSVPISEIADPKNDYNLNLPRYIDTSEPEDLQDLDAHLNGGIPNRDLDDLAPYWQAFPSLRDTLFKPSDRDGYSVLAIPAEDINSTVNSSPEFEDLKATVHARLEGWSSSARPAMASLGADTHPRDFISGLSESILEAFRGTELIDEYALYQSLMEYWSDTMRDDVYLIAEVGWDLAAKPSPSTNGNRVDFVVGKEKFTSELLPAELLIDQFFTNEQAAVVEAESLVAVATEQLNEMFDEYGGDEGLLSDLFADKERISAKAVKARLKADDLDSDEKKALDSYTAALEKEAAAKKTLKDTSATLNDKVADKYGKLSTQAIQDIAIDDKWLTAVKAFADAELERVSQALTGRIRELSRRYGQTLPECAMQASLASEAVDSHLRKMGLSW